jgi:hypothetical protein
MEEPSGGDSGGVPPLQSSLVVPADSLFWCF